MKIIPRKLRKLGTTLVETLPPIGLAGFLATTLLPALSKARSKSNRAKCSNNLKNQVNAYTMFSNDNNGRYPWLMRERDGTAVISYMSPGGGGALRFEWDSLLDIRRLHQTQAIHDALKTAKLLLSPCDPGAKLKNQEESQPGRMFFGWEGKFGNMNSPEAKMNRGWKRKEIDEGAQSYSICFGADAQKGEKGIILLTRNHGGEWNSGYEYRYPGGTLKYGGRLARSKSMVNLGKTDGWLDPERVPPAGMHGAVLDLRANEGQMAFCDGHAIMANDKDLKEAIKEHKHNEAGLLNVPNFNTCCPNHNAPD